MNYIERNKIETIYKDDYTDFTRLSDFEIFTKDILVSLKKLNIKETKKKYENKYAFINNEKNKTSLAPLSLVIIVEDSCKLLKKYIKKDYIIKLNYVYFPYNKCQKIFPFHDSSYIYNKNVTIVNSFYCLHGNLNCSEVSLFPARTFPIQRFFFVNEYIELEINDKNGLEDERCINIEHFSISSLILNSLKLALSELDISVPTFIIIDKNEHIYHGHFHTNDYIYYKCINPLKLNHRENKKRNNKEQKKNISLCNNEKIKNYIALFKGVGLEVNYHSFKFYNYFKCFTFDHLLSLFCLFIYLANIKGNNIYNINIHLKNIYLIDKLHNYKFPKSLNLKNKKYDLLKIKAKGTNEKCKSKYTLKNRYMLNIYKNKFSHIYLDNIFNYIKKNRYYSRKLYLSYFTKMEKNYNDMVLKQNKENKRNNYLYNSKNNFCKHNYVSPFNKIENTALLSDDDYKFSDYFSLYTSSYSSVTNENFSIKKKSTFEEINHLFDIVRNHKNIPKNDNFFLSIYVLNFIKNMQHKILNNNENEKNKIINIWKIRFINNDKYKGKNSYLLKNILNLYYNELSELKKKKNDKSYKNDQSIENIIIKYIPIKNKKWLKHDEASSFNCFNIEDEYTRYHIDSILNNMFSNNKKKIYEYNYLRKNRLIHLEDKKNLNKVSLKKKNCSEPSYLNEILINNNILNNNVEYTHENSSNQHKKNTNSFFKINQRYHKLYKNNRESFCFFLCKNHFLKRNYLYKKKKNKIKFLNSRKKNIKKRKNEKKLQQIIRDFLIIKKKYFLCHQEEKISILFCYLASHSSNIKTFYYIWNQFFDNLRNKYENNEYIFNDHLVLSYGPLNIYSYSCSILSQYIKALNISTQQFKINEKRNQMKQKKTLNFFCNESNSSVSYNNSNLYDFLNDNENDTDTNITRNKSNSSSTNLKNDILSENIIFSSDMNNNVCKNEINKNNNYNFELEYIKEFKDPLTKNSIINSENNNNLNNINNININNNKFNNDYIDNIKNCREKKNVISLRKRNVKEKKIVLSNFFPFPLINMELFISKNNVCTKNINDQDEMIFLIHEILKNKNKDNYNFTDFIKWYKINIGKVYTSQNLLKYCYNCIKNSYFVNIDALYIKDKYKEIKRKYYMNNDYLKNMFDYVKNNYDYIKKIKSPFNTFFVGELNLDNLLNMSILDILECVYKIFFISYISSIMHSKLIYIKKIQDILSKLFTIIKKLHKKKKKKMNNFLRFLLKKCNSQMNENEQEYIQQKNQKKEQSNNEPNDMNNSPSNNNLMKCKEKNNPATYNTKEDNFKGNNSEDDFCSINNIDKEYDKSGRKNNLRENKNINSSEKSSNNNLDMSYKEQSLNYKNNYCNSKDENYFKNFHFDHADEKKRTTYNDMHFINRIRKIYKKRYKIIFNKRLFNLFEKCEELYDKSVWLFKIFSNNLNEKKIFKIINIILESDEKEIIIKPKYEKYFYNFIKNLSLYNSRNLYDKKLSNNLKFNRINRSILQKNDTNKNKKTKNTKYNISNSYQNFGVSVKIKKNESLLKHLNNEQNILHKDKFSLLLHSNNKEQNIQECIIDYVDCNFLNPIYNNPTRMYCSINQFNSTVSFIKVSPTL
ncbi:conserved Plasmodium protein, unknown function [Plasmodium relictum]|uniref:Uncharacterized protein n=1 Tax=Plasmodium relictum TaxID=85471 RepID=A0A1J1HEB4_PLARL|nr:conserved Plasmodium protein, unknown function [Plasmodium relictum]CRH03886.1 conserved Plasmodium protein, unknown function [Plasmodium relictum]